MTQYIGHLTMLPCALIFEMVTLTSSVTLELAKAEHAWNIKKKTFNKCGAHFLRHKPSFMIAFACQAWNPWRSAFIHST
uniref:Putative basic tail protein n=1 Tax=Ixodes ricinus TaxID=34613 RepID=A0A0K8REU3_IXORI